MENQAPPGKHVEKLDYTMGGFHPVHLDDQFKKERYRVIHKLGHGGFAMVWLARDQKRERYVGLKILASRLSHDCPEVEILRRLRSSPDHKGKPYVMSLLDHFWVDGPNGKHLCVVSEVGGPTIRQFNDCPGQSGGTRRLRASVARKVALQATEGLAYIHFNGIVHGDFTCSNILLQLANIDEWTVEEIHERLGKPQKHEIAPEFSAPLESSSPRYTVQAIDMKKVHSRWLSDQIMIIDFGIAFFQDKPSPNIGTPKIYYAPEFLFEGARSVSSDIWALGCTLYELRTGASLFRYKGKPSRGQILTAMVKVLGALPETWWNDWEEGRAWYESESKEGGELVDTVPETLYRQILGIGVHEDDTQAVDSPGKSVSAAHNSVDECGNELVKRDVDSTSTRRMIALVEELSTSGAAEVIAQANKSNSSSAGEGKFKSASDSTNTKSTEKSISSEGVSTGNKVPKSAGRVDNLIGTESRGVIGSVDNATATASVVDFLETEGTLISEAEARGLENLLRKVLRYLPEQRLAPSELAKHHWFFDDLEARNEKGMK